MDKKNKTSKTKANMPVVDITWCESADDIKVSFIYAKVENGICITTDELNFIVLKAINATISTFQLVDKIMMDVAETFNCGRCMIENFCKKEPWYKRLWKRIKYAFTW